MLKKNLKLASKKWIIRCFILFKLVLQIRRCYRIPATYPWSTWWKQQGQNRVVPGIKFQGKKKSCWWFLCFTFWKKYLEESAKNSISSKAPGYFRQLATFARYTSAASFLGWVWNSTYLVPKHSTFFTDGDRKRLCNEIDVTDIKWQTAKLCICCPWWKTDTRRY